MSELLALSPIDGRYANETEILRNHLSEFAFFKYRIVVEIDYLVDLLIFLKDDVIPDDIKSILEIKNSFNLNECKRIKEIEKTTNHDVKAIEYYIRAKLNENRLDKYNEFVHFGLTSQDINNTAYPMMLRDATKVLLEKMMKIENSLKKMDPKKTPMLARTHGQPATPTTVDFQMKVFAERLNKIHEEISSTKYSCKFSGATGGFNAHFLAYPDRDWPSFADSFCKRYGLDRQQYTTQIDHYDDISDLFNNLTRYANVSINLCRDMWDYIKDSYFIQIPVKNEVGSSAMPHKVNPINFENAEGNFSISNALLGFLADKLPISRRQRDLTDSTSMRSVGTAYGHFLVALTNLQRGLSKIKLHEEVISSELSAHPEVLSEAIQILLRKENIPNGYDIIKNLTRGEEITYDVYNNIVNDLPLSPESKDILHDLTPDTYLPMYP
jgi:adenylosuccinate lyase